MEWSKVNGDVRYGFTPERGFPDMPEGSEYYADYLRGIHHKVHAGYPGTSTTTRPIQVGRPGGLHRQSSLESKITPSSQEYSFSIIPTNKSKDEEFLLRFDEKKLFQAYCPSETDKECSPFPTYLDSDQACSSTSLCSECPPRGVTYPYGTPTETRPAQISDIKSNLRTGADGRLSGGEFNLLSSANLQSSSFPELLPLDANIIRTDDSIESHCPHASKCDISEFKEWQSKRINETFTGLPPDLEKHLMECRCSCDHLGFGNYQTMMEFPVAHISRTHSCESESCGRKDVPSGAYTQIQYLDSPRSTSSTGFVNRIKVPVEIHTNYWWIIGIVFLVAACAVVGVSVPLALRGDPNQSLDRRLALAKQILSESPLIDGHNDLPWNIRSFIHNKLENLKLNESLKQVEPWSNSNWSHTDIPRLKEGMVSGVFWSAYTPCSAQYLNPVQLTLEQIDVIKRMVKKYKNVFQLVTESEDIMKAFKAGKIASMIGIEGGHSISSSLGTLRIMYELGVRYLTLTHTCNTPWATSSIVENDKKLVKDYSGLNEFGERIVREMNRLGMMVDLSHVSTRTMREALAATHAPIIFSHSAARAICPLSRNVPDDVLKQVKNNRGIVMVNFFADFIRCDGAANLTHVAAHINHIRKVAGIDHVGLGGDFDGINRTPKGLEDVSKYPMLIAELLKNPDWTGADVRKLIGENIIRVFSEVELIRDRLQRKGYLPIEEEIHPQVLRHLTNCTLMFE